MPHPEEIRRQIISLVADYQRAAFAPRTFVPGETTVRYGGRVFDADELVHAVDACLDFWLTAGRFSEQFEADLAQRLDLDTALLVNSGSSANLVAMSALTSPSLGQRRVQPGDEVVTVAAGFPTTVNPIIQNRAVPVFVDVELGTYVPSVDAVAAAIGPKTKAVLIAHTMGIPYGRRGDRRPVSPARTLAHRRLLRRARHPVGRPLRRHARRSGHGLLLPGPSDHDG